MPDLASRYFIQLVPGNNDNISVNNEAAQYQTPNISIKSMKEYNSLQVKMVFKRNPYNIFMKTYIPTIIINLINTATNFWDDPEMFEAVVTINLTCLMVL